jgi:tRNA (cytidine32/uridine32-2'-O)-methyltransferase
MLSKIRIILVETSHAGNIGSAARAMKTMGLNDLALVAPRKFPHAKATALASNAADLLDQAVVFESLDEAIADCDLIIGTSTRSRTIPWPLLTPREFAEKVKNEAGQLKKVAVLFGREASGLTNEELHRCHFHIQIPTNPEYSSLNIACALQVIAYELRVASLQAGPANAQWDYPFATAAQMESFYEHLHRVLINTEFLNPAVPRQLMTRLRRLFSRARVDEMEMNILRGILKAVEKNLKP